MVEILHSNFNNYKEEIRGKLEKASFIAIDTELSGLSTGADSSENSIFDNFSSRYGKLRKNAQDFSIIQFGLSLFTYHREDNKFVSDIYTFYLRPLAFAKTRKFLFFDVSAIEFLIKHNFDFNKLTYDGIRYVNIEDEKSIRNQLTDGSFMRHLERDEHDTIQEILKKERKKINQWLQESKQCFDPGNLSISTRWKTNLAPIIAYQLHLDIRQKFLKCWTLVKEDCVEVYTIKAAQREKLNPNSDLEGLQNDIITYLAPFSAFFEMLGSAKKPLVGHNLIIDLVTMYNQFSKPLPKSSESFKKDITNLFPTIFDTKHMSFELRKLLPGKYRSTFKSDLEGLHKFLTGGRGVPISFHLADVVSTTEFSEDVSFHNAGYDAYITGCVFLRMANIFATIKRGKDWVQQPLTCTELMLGIDNLRNRINLTRATIHYANLDGPDPPISKTLLNFKRKDEGIIKEEDLDQSLAKYGDLGLRIDNEKTALVAVPFASLAKKIMSDKDIKEIYTVTQCKLNGMIENLIRVAVGATSIFLLWKLKKIVM